VLKGDTSNSLVDAIQSLAEHKPYFTAKITAFVLKGYLNPNTRESSALTPREREIMQLVAEGKSTKQVADALTISIKTVETHRTNLMRKLHLHSVADLTRYAIRNQIVQA
jgi:DNA-binding NarL/FixJ family response regulator